MPLDDVWKTFDRSIGLHYTARFDQVPPFPGVYAWFYPLRVTSYELDTFLAEVRAVHLYDARRKARPSAAGSARFGWSILEWKAELNDPRTSLPEKCRATWERLAGEPEAFDDLRRVLLQASLLMPPLYVGKAVNLRTRCAAHLDGRSNFAERFEARAKEIGLQARRVRDLILVTMRTESVGDETDESESLVEEILKLVARPPYGVT
jgi:hypothetical protein